MYTLNKRTGLCLAFVLLNASSDRFSFVKESCLLICVVEVNLSKYLLEHAIRRTWYDPSCDVAYLNELVLPLCGNTSRPLEADCTQSWWTNRDLFSKRAICVFCVAQSRNVNVVLFRPTAAYKHTRHQVSTHNY
jgi:hypothetical protein